MAATCATSAATFVRRRRASLCTGSTMLRFTRRGAPASRNRRGDGIAPNGPVAPRPVGKLPKPEFEAHDRPQLLAEIGRTGKVTRHQAFDVRRRQDAAVAGARLQEEIAHV